MQNNTIIKEATSYQKGTDTKKYNFKATDHSHIDPLSCYPGGLNESYFITLV